MVNIRWRSWRARWTAGWADTLGCRRRQRRMEGERQVGFQRRLVGWFKPVGELPLTAGGSTAYGARIPLVAP